MSSPFHNPYGSPPSQPQQQNGHLPAPGMGNPYPGTPSPMGAGSQSYPPQQLPTPVMPPIVIAVVVFG